VTAVISTADDLLTGFLAQVQTRVQQQLQLRLQDLAVAPSLAEAMRYSVLSGGKRLRAALVYASCLAFSADWAAADQVAMALELMHAYSLVHDDLPAMDNDVLRRGLPTCHVAFDEATAILAGDALQSLAFEVLAESRLPPTDVVKMLMILAKASGAQGMAGGQALDLAATGQPQLAATAEHLARIHQHKTGCLIVASVQLGALAAGGDALPDRTQVILAQFGQAIGLGFQIQDDILDVTSSTAALGKTAGVDQQLAKLTYPSLMGLSAAKQLAQQQLLNAQQALQQIPRADTRLLQALAVAFIERHH
jgi:geranylgeranyl pyrophosphate synthase